MAEVTDALEKCVGTLKSSVSSEEFSTFVKNTQATFDELNELLKGLKPVVPLDIKPEEIQEKEEIKEVDLETEPPFALITIQPKGMKEAYLVGIGKGLATDKVFGTKEDAIRYVRQKDWKVIASLMKAALDAELNNNNQKEENNE